MENNTRIVHLEMTAAEILSKGKQLRLSRDLMEQVLIRRLLVLLLRDDIMHLALFENHRSNVGIFFSVEFSFLANVLNWNGRTVGMAIGIILKEQKFATYSVDAN
ncbi:hypothetical protein CQW23_20650 [Capsicum baccatum]|uniref:Uncharacterized protein n=1 Tax=Capsicum baccatum TaxID=33114 RepID=A0A2G2W989_CAPBA|nr:hypothetical protein CQW23_20650 [Capsicum baccatum]